MESLTLDQPHWEALTPLTLEAFHLLSQWEEVQRFYLAGGTGLALHLGHRFSVDLDFFSDEKDAVNPAQRAALRSLLNDPTLAITYDEDGSFVVNWRGVGISFLNLESYPLVRPTLLLNGVRLASLIEIGAMKLAAIINRGTRKDMVDLYYILQRVRLETLFEAAAIKYAKIRSFPVMALRAMSYFEDAEALPMPLMIDRTDWSKMKKFLEAKALEAGRKQLSDLWRDASAA